MADIKISKKEQELLDYLKKNKISISEAKKLFQAEPRKFQEVKLGISDKHVRFGVISDTHIGHKCYRPDILEHFAKYIKHTGCEFVLHCGDILEGMSQRDGQIYELSHIGATSQLDYAVEQLSQIEKTIYGITATNSHDGWYSSKGNMGFEIGPMLESKLNQFKFLGYDEADVKLNNGLIIRMVHPGDGTAYAHSYKIQRYVNSLSGGRKPNVLLEGHYHKSLYIMYRNIHCFEAGTLEEQTTFMKKKGLSAVLGYWILDVSVGKRGGVNKINMEFVPFYEDRIRQTKRK